MNNKIINDKNIFFKYKLMLIAIIAIMLNASMGYGEITNDITLSNITVSAGQTFAYIARNSISAGTNYNINSNASVTFTAGSSIRLKGGFRAKAGAGLQASIENDLFKEMLLIDTSADIHLAHNFSSALITPLIFNSSMEGRFIDRSGHQRPLTEEEIREDMRASDWTCDANLIYHNFSTDLEHPELPAEGYLGKKEGWGWTFHDIVTPESYAHWVEVKQKYNPNFGVIRYNIYCPVFVRGGAQYPDPEYSGDYETLYFHTSNAPSISNRACLTSYRAEDIFSNEKSPIYSDEPAWLPFSRSTGGEYGGTGNNDFVYKNYFCNPIIPADPDNEHYLIGIFRRQYRTITQEAGYDGMYLDNLFDVLKKAQIQGGALPYEYNAGEFKTNVQAFANNLKGFLNTLPKRKILVGNALFIDDAAMRYVVNIMLGEGWVEKLNGYVSKAVLLTQMDKVKLYNEVPSGTVLYKRSSATYYDEVEDIQKRFYLLAMYLIVKGKYTWMIAGNGCGSRLPPFPEHLIKIGRPLADYYATGTNDIFYREFTRCWAMASPNESGSANSTLSGAYYRLGLDLIADQSPVDVGRLTYAYIENVTGIPVGARQGIILMKPLGAYISKFAWDGSETIKPNQQLSGHVSLNLLNLHTTKIDTSSIALNFCKGNINMNDYFRITRIDTNSTSFNLGEEKAFKWDVEVGQVSPGDSIYVVPIVNAKDNGNNDAPVNSLIANGGFEFDNLAWTTNGTGSIGIDNSVRHYGSKSAKISGTGTGFYDSDKFNVIPNDKLILQGWVKTSSVVGSAYISVTYYTVSGAFLSQVNSQYLTGDNDWTHYTVYSQAPQEAGLCSVKLCLNRTQGAAWFDDICLTFGFNWDIIK